MICNHYEVSPKDMPAIIAALVATREIVQVIKVNGGFLVLHKPI